MLSSCKSYTDAKVAPAAKSLNNSTLQLTLVDLVTDELTCCLGKNAALTYLQTASCKQLRNYNN